MTRIEEYRACLSPKNRVHVEEILKQFRVVESKIKRIDKSDTAPWIRDKNYEFLKTLYTPAVKNAIEVLQNCTVESIKENYDCLLNYLCNKCLLTEEIADEILSNRGLKVFARYEQFPTNFNKRIVATYKDGEKEHRLDSNDDIFIMKGSHYCVHFTKNCSLEEVEWFLEHRLKNELKPNAKKKKHRTASKSLKQKAFIGILTAYGEKPSHIIDFCNLYLPFDEKFSYLVVKRIRNRLIRDDWFRKAQVEKETIKNLPKTQEMLASRNEKLKKMGERLEKQEGGLRLTDEESSIIGHPHYLKLVFNNTDSLFHVESSLL